MHDASDRKLARAMVCGIALAAGIGVGCSGAESRVVEDPELGRTPGTPGGPLAGGQRAVELINPITGEIWLTTHFAPQEFEALEVAFWLRKNLVREVDGEGIESVFERSPRAALPGEFEVREIYGKPFLLVAKLVSRPEKIDPEGLLHRIRVQKFLRVSFPAGHRLNVLVGPDGTGWVRSTPDHDRPGDEGRVPPGFEIRQRVLGAPRSIELSGTIEVIRDERHAYQGPVDLARLGLPGA